MGKKRAELLGESTYRMLCNIHDRDPQRAHYWAWWAAHHGARALKEKPMGLIPTRLKRGLLMRVVLWGTKGIANGKFGRGPQRAWLFLEGSKTYLGLAFMLAGYAFGAAFNLGICEQCPEWDKILMGVGVVMAQIGLLDAANREDGPNAARTDAYLLRERLGDMKRDERE